MKDISRNWFNKLGASCLLIASSTLGFSSLNAADITIDEVMGSETTPIGLTGLTLSDYSDTLTITENGSIYAEFVSIQIEQSSLSDYANSGDIVNHGNLGAGAFIGLLLNGYNTGNIVNEVDGILTDALYGFAVQINNGTLTNSGIISDCLQVAIYMQSNGGLIENTSTGIISNVGLGIAGDVNFGTIHNSGSIGSSEMLTGEYGIEIYDENSGTITNSGVIYSNDSSIIVGDFNNFYAADDSLGGYYDALNSGAITNSGTLYSEVGAGILVDGDSSGDITNTETGYISGVIGIGVTGINSATILNQGTIEVTDYDGISVGTNEGSIINEGSISSDDWDGIYVRLDNDGNILNAEGATITALDGFYLEADNNGTLTNNGMVTATTDMGVYLAGDNTGTIENGETGTIQSHSVGILAIGENSGSIINAGVLDVAIEGGIYTNANSGNISNSGSITVADGFGVYATNNTGTIDNSGTITVNKVEVFDWESGHGIAVWELNSGTVSNSGSIDAEDNGILVFGRNDGIVINEGEIVAQIAGIAVRNNDNGALVSNAEGGTITSEDAGIQVYGHNGEESTIANYGSIVSVGNGIDLGIGVYMDSGYAVNAGTVLNSGEIDSDSYGIYLKIDNTGDVYNSGIINSENTGIYVGSTSTGYIENSGSIITYGSGIYVSDASESGTIVNSGMIDALDSGIYAEIGGSITNSGTISSDILGIFGYGDIYNSGDITVSGDIVGMNAGIISAGENVYNTGSIDVTNSSSSGESFGIYMYDLDNSEGVNYITNTGDISSDDYAIYAQGYLSVVYLCSENDDYGIDAYTITGDIYAETERDSRLYVGMDYGYLIEGGDDPYNSNLNLTYDGSITNYGLLVGGGTLTLNGDSNLSALAINSGNTQVYINGEVTVNGFLFSGGLLGGNGNLIAREEFDGEEYLGVFYNMGTFAPGQSNGIFTVDGNFYNLGVVELEVDTDVANPVAGVDYDQVVVTSGIEGQDAEVLMAEGSVIRFVSSSQVATPGAVYNFLRTDSGSFSGTYDEDGSGDGFTIEDNLDDYAFYLYGETNTAGGLSFNSIVARDHDLGKFATSEAQSSVAEYLTDLEESDDYEGLLFSLRFIAEDSDYDLALERLSGEVYPSLISLEQTRISDLTDLVATSMRPFDTSDDAGMTGQWFAFAKGYGSELESSSANVADLKYRDRGGLVGVGLRKTEHWDLGGSLALDEGTISNDHPDSVDTEARNVSLYARYNNQGDYYLASVSYGKSDYDVLRTSEVAMSNAVVERETSIEKASLESDYLSAYLEKGYTWAVEEKYSIQPFIGLQYTEIDMRNFVESNLDEMSLSGHFDSWTSVIAKVGLSGNYKMFDRFSFGFNALWSHEFDDPYARMSAAFQGVTDRLEVNGLSMSKDSLTLGISSRFSLSDKVDLYAAYSYVNGDEIDVKKGNVGVLYQW